MSLVVLLVLLLVVVVVGGSLALGIRAVRTGGPSRTPDERRHEREGEALERRYQEQRGDLPPTHEQL
jgi:hypothetical protein